jgi:hypothetical protein
MASPRPQLTLRITSPSNSRNSSPVSLLVPDTPTKGSWESKKLLIVYGFIIVIAIGFAVFMAQWYRQRIMLKKVTESKSAWIMNSNPTWPDSSNVPECVLEVNYFKITGLVEQIQCGRRRDTGEIALIHSHQREFSFWNTFGDFAGSFKVESFSAYDAQANTCVHSLDLPDIICESFGTPMEVDDDQ